MPHYYSQLHPRLSTFSVLSNLKVEAEMLTRWRKTQLSIDRLVLAGLAAWLRGRVPPSNLTLATVHSSACRKAEDKWCNRDLQIQQPAQEIFRVDCCCFHFPEARKHKHVRCGWSSLGKTHKQLISFAIIKTAISASWLTQGAFVGLLARICLGGVLSC